MLMILPKNSMKNFLVAGKTGTTDIRDKTSQNVAYVSYFPYNDP